MKLTKSYSQILLLRSKIKNLINGKLNFSIMLKLQLYMLSQELLRRLNVNVLRMPLTLKSFTIRDLTR